MENTAPTRYKNSHPVPGISSENLFRWKDPSCSQSAPWREDENPSQTGLDEKALAVIPGTPPLAQTWRGE